MFISSEHTAGIPLEIAPAIKNITTVPFVVETESREGDPSAFPNYIFGLMWADFAFNQTNPTLEVQNLNHYEKRGVWNFSEIEESSLKCFQDENSK